MTMTIPPEFEAFVRQQVEAGIFTSEQDAVDAVLKGYLADVHAFRASIQDGIAAFDRGEGIDGEAFMAEMLADTESLDPSPSSK